MKKLVIGIIIGLILSIPVGAAVQEYTLKQSECKIVVNGEEVKGELPLLIMDPGFNYIPAAEFRSICDKMGIGFEFDVPTKEIRIDTKKRTSSSKEADTVGEVIEQTPDGITVVTKKDGIKYVRLMDVGRRYEYKNIHFKISTANNNDNPNICDMYEGDTLIYSGILSEIFSVTREYYIKNIMPLLQD
jgi:hypothetical protein